MSSTGVSYEPALLVYQITLETLVQCRKSYTEGSQIRGRLCALHVRHMNFVRLNKSTEETLRHESGLYVISDLSCKVKAVTDLD